MLRTEGYMAIGAIILFACTLIDSIWEGEIAAGIFEKRPIRKKESPKAFWSLIACYSLALIGLGYYIWNSRFTGR